MLRNPAPAIVTGCAVSPLSIKAEVDAFASSWAISRGLRRSFFESCIATLLERSPCSGFFGRSMSISRSASAGATLRTASSRIFLNVSLGSAMKGRELYAAGLVELDRIDVEMPADVARRVCEQPLGERREILLPGAARRRLHQQLPAPVGGAPRGDMRARLLPHPLRPRPLPRSAPPHATHTSATL